MTIHAIYENGDFWPIETVNLPEKTRVRITTESPAQLPNVSLEGMQKIMEILGQSVYDPESPGNLAERHNEHQP